MTTLIFEHEGWIVVTASWTAAAKPGENVVICYEWGADRVAWLATSVSTARITLNMTIEKFIATINGKDIVDFRNHNG